MMNRILQLVPGLRAETHRPNGSAVVPVADTSAVNARQEPRGGCVAGLEPSDEEEKRGWIRSNLLRVMAHSRKVANS